MTDSLHCKNLAADFFLRYIARMSQHSFKVKVWKYKGKAGWYFATLPKTLSKKIRSSHGSSEEGWGRLKTTATIGTSNWKTAIWYDTKSQAYLLPIKATIRKKEKIEEGHTVKVDLTLEAAHTTRHLGNWLVNQSRSSSTRRISKT